MTDRLFSWGFQLGRFITKREAERRTGLKLISDRNVSFFDKTRGLLRDVYEGQRETERKYPKHKLIRLAAINHFLNEGYDVYRNGITVNGTGTCPDFAIFKGDSITFVGCLTWTGIYGPTIRKKKRIKRYAPLIFVVEGKSSIKFESPKDEIAYVNRVRKLAKTNSVYWCNSKKAKLRKCRPGKFN